MTTTDSPETDLRCQHQGAVRILMMNRPQTKMA